MKVEITPVEMPGEMMEETTGTTKMMEVKMPGITIRKMIMAGME